MNKDSTVSARVETDIKNEAEDILKQLGIPVSVLINSLYRQIIIKKGIPFNMNLASDSKEPKSLDTMTVSELNAMLEHSYAQVRAGEGRPARDVFRDLENDRGSHERQAV